MEPVYANIILSNPVVDEIKPIEVRCLVDTGSTYLCIPQHIATKLQIKMVETRTDGSNQSVPYGGPIKVSFDNRSCFVGSLIAEDEILLGTIPIQDMDLIVQHKLLELTVNPESPNIPRGHMK